MKKLVLLLCAFFYLTTINLQAAEEKEWTFLLFLNGNNNLDDFGTLNMNQMESVGSSAKINLVVQWASLEHRTVRRVLVQKDNDMRNVTSPVLEDLGMVDMGDHRNLTNFIRWGVANYPAKKYFVAVWNHGSGWHKIDRIRKGELSPQDISWDDFTGNVITTEELGTVMRDMAREMGRKIDVYGSDACLMGMVEVAGEMEGAVDYFLGSQDLEPGAGWPYDKVFARLDTKPEMSPREFSTMLTEEYVKSYQGGSNGRSEVTFSAFDMSKYAGFRNAIGEFSTSIRGMPSSSKDKVKAAANAAQDFYYSDYVDVGDFLLKVESSGALSDNRSIATAKAALKDFVLINRVTDSFKKAQGVSFWIPKSTSMHDGMAERYKKLAFDRDANWSGALSAFLK